MTINDQIRNENYSMTLVEKQPKYQLYHQAKLINMNILLVKIYYHLITANNRTSKIYLFSIAKSFRETNKNN